MLFTRITQQYAPLCHLMCWTKGLCGCVVCDRLYCLDICAPGLYSVDKHRSHPPPRDSSLFDSPTHYISTKMPQHVLSANESSSGEDDFAIMSYSVSPGSWSLKLTRIDQRPGKTTDNEKDARKITFCRLPTSSFQSPPTPPSSMLTRALRRLTVNNSQASMKWAENYRKREWDSQGWSELSHCQQYEQHRKRNKHMIGPAEEEASKRFEHGGDEELRRYAW